MILTDPFTGHRQPTPMTQILDRLWLGGFQNAEDLKVSNPHAITRIVNCTRERLVLPLPVTPRDPTGFEVIQLDQLDETPWNPARVREAIEWMQAQHRQGRTILVHCHAGMSRSPSLVAGYLYACGWDFDRALAYLQTKRPWIRPYPVMLTSMRAAFGSPAPSPHPVTS